MTAAASLPRPAAAAPADAPTRAVQLANLAIFQAAWFCAVLGAAHGRPLWGTAGIAAAIAWHLAVSARPAREARLVAAACAIGAVVETAMVLQGHIAYPSGQPVAWLAPYWMVALWGLLAIAPNVTLRWLKGRPVLAAALGAVGGPLSFIAGSRLGGATLVDPVPALATMAAGWAVLMPVLMGLAERYDGVTRPVPEQRRG